MMPTCPDPECACPIQRTITGTLLDGYDAHLEWLHGGECGPVLADLRDTFIRLHVSV